MKTQDVTDEELAMFKTRARVDLLRSLADNEGLAQSLATYQLRYGDWRELFRQLDKIDKVSKADIRRVSNKVFTENNRTYAIIETVPQQKPDGAAKAGGTVMLGSLRCREQIPPLRFAPVGMTWVCLRGCVTHPRGRTAGPSLRSG